MEYSIDIGAALLAAIALYFAYQANKKSDKANQIAQNALDITRMDHAIDTQPHFTASASKVEFIQTGPYHTAVITLKNENAGWAAINKLVFAYPRVDVTSLPLPLELPYGNQHSFVVKFNYEDFKHYERAVHSGLYLHAGQAILEDARFEIHFADAFKNNFIAAMQYSSGRRMFIGENRTAR